jgi:hypothetical protein
MSLAFILKTMIKSLTYKTTFLVFEEKIQDFHLDPHIGILEYNFSLLLVSVTYKFGQQSFETLAK